MKWLLWMSVLFFLSCGKSFEKEAEQHLDKIIEDTAIDPGCTLQIYTPHFYVI